MSSNFAGLSPSNDGRSVATLWTQGSGIRYRIATTHAIFRTRARMRAHSRPPTSCWTRACYRRAVSAPTVLFANPTAQSGKASEWIKQARALLAAAGIDHEFVSTEPDGGTVGVVRRAIDDDGARCVIYMGGDGTFAEVAKGVLGSGHVNDVAMGMLPTGTANDQGKSFGLAAGVGALARNVEVIAARVTTDIDVGRIAALDEGDEIIKSDLVFDSASIGVGAATLLTRNRDREAVSEVPVLRQIYRDQLVYAGAMIQRLIGSVIDRFARFDLEAVVDGVSYEYQGLIDVILKNTHIFGGEWVLAPDGQVDDGLFEMVPVASVRDFTSKMLATLRHSPINEQDLEKLGIHHSKPVPGSSFVLTVHQPGASAPPPCQIDGEEFVSSDKIRVDVLQRCLHIIVPREAARDPDNTEQES